MVKCTVQFRETILKSVDIYGNNTEEFKREMQRYMDNPDECIDFEKNFDDIKIDAVHASRPERVEK